MYILKMYRYNYGIKVRKDNRDYFLARQVRDGYASFFVPAFELQKTGTLSHERVPVKNN